MNQCNYDQFQKDVSNHVLTVNMDSGLFRDLTIKRPQSNDMHYHITTRPNYLFITGDMGSFTFSVHAIGLYDLAKQSKPHKDSSHEQN